MIYVIVGLAGVCGALLRYAIGLWVLEAGWASIWATLPINLAGCFILAAFTAYTIFINPKLHPWIKAGFGTGFVGAFTTFSTFSLETVRLMQGQHYAGAALYVLSSLWGGLGAAWLGWRAISSLAERYSRKEETGMA